MIQKKNTIAILKYLALLAVGMMALQAQAGPLNAPSIPSAVMTARPPLKVNLAWQDNSANETGFTIQRAANVFFNSGLTTFSVGANIKTYADASVQKNATYYYRVQARIGSGVSAWSGLISVATLTPDAPVSLMGMKMPASSNAPTVKLAWRDNANNEGGFTLQRATDSGFSKHVSNFTLAANLAKYTDSAVEANTKIYYRVRAFNGAGNSAWSNVLKLTAPGELPDNPAKLSVIGSDSSSITIGWTDNANNEQGFIVERSAVGFNGPWSKIATITNDNAVSYKNSGLAKKTMYWYRVQAYNSDGDSGYTNVVAGTTKP